MWLERGGRQVSSPLNSLADHQKLKVIQKWAFYFFDWRGVADRVWVHQPARPIIRSWMLSKNEHFIFLTGEGWQTAFESIDQPNQSSEVEHNPKMSILFFGWRGVADRIWVHWPAQPDYQKLNVIQKWAFYFFDWRRVAHGVSSPSTSPADHQKLNVIQKWAYHFFGWRGVADGVQVHQLARPIIRSWT